MTAKRITIACLAGLTAGPVLAGVATPVDITIGDLPDGKAIIICHSVTVNGGTSVISQGTVIGSNFTNFLTDDPDTAAPSDTTVTGVQLPPVVSNLSLNINEDNIVTFGTTAFDGGFSDGNAGDTLQVLRITSLPNSGGVLFRSGGGGAITGGDLPLDIPRAQIAGMQYIPQPNFGGPTEVFGWNASDGTDFATSPASYIFNITEQNDPPLPTADTVLRYPTSSVKIKVADLLLNDNDPSDSPPDLPLTLNGVNYTGGNGASVTLVGDTIFYLPNGHTGDDTFTYELRDARGGVFPIAPVTVKAIVDDDPTGNITETEVLPGGAIKTTFAGIPGRTYIIQASETLLPGSWVNVGLETADGLGRLMFTDPPPVPPIRFYRTVEQP